MNVLGILVHEYEERNVLIPDLSSIELLKVLIDEFGFKQKDLIPIFKTEFNYVCNSQRKRKLTIEYIEELSDLFNVSPSKFLVDRHKALLRSSFISALMPVY